MFARFSRSGRTLLSIGVLGLLPLLATAATAGEQLPGRAAMPMSPPALGSPSTITVGENTGSNLSTTAFTATDNGATMSTPTCSVSDGNVAESVSGTGLTATCTYTPNLDFIGTDTLSYSVTDSLGGDLTGTITINVIAAITVTASQSVQTLENTPIQVATDTVVQAGTSVQSVVVTSLPVDGTVNCESVSPYFCTYTPNPGFHGTDSFTFTVVGTPGGSATGTVSVTVVAPAPFAPSPQDFETPENTPLTVSLSVSDAVPGNLYYTVSTQAGHGRVKCTLVGGPCTYYPNRDFHGLDNFVVSIADENGNTITVAVEIQVTHVDQPPESPQPMTLVITANSVGYIDVLTYSHDADHRDRLFVSTPTPTAAHGTVSCPPKDGCFYHPNPDYVGPDSFDFTVDDGHDQTFTGTVNVTVRPAPTP